MTQPGPTPEPDPGDALRPVTLDPRIWTGNLAALATVDPDLARDLAAVELPLHWRPAQALDDTPTWRLERPPGSPEWLSGTAAPRTRARGLLGHFDATGRNLALATIGTGAELELLLARLPLHTAVFAFEQDPRVLAAVLRLHDLAASLAAGRCILVPPGREQPWLLALLARRCGVLPPGDIVLPELVPPERIRELKQVCEEVMQATITARERRLEQIRAAAAPDRPAGPHRGLVFALLQQPATHSLAAQLAAAGRRLGWEMRTCTLSGPDQVHPLAPAEYTAEFRPTFTLSINHTQNLLAIGVPAPALRYIIDAPSAAAATDDGAHYLAASPVIAAALRARGLPAAAVRPWYWAYAAPPAAPAAPDDTLLLIADLPDTRPEPYSVVHSTHRILWTELQRTASREWEWPRSLETEKLLVRAERACHVEVRDALLRAGLIRLVEQVLLPAATLEHVARTLVELGPTRVLGRGWETRALPGVQVHDAAPADYAALHALAPPRACVFAGRPDPLCAALVYAAGQGWPLLLQHPGGAPLGDRLGDLLRAGQHYTAFADVGELRSGIRSVHESSLDVQRRAERAASYVGARHSCEERLRGLVEQLEQRASEL